MKKILIAVLACLMLTGCGNAESKETSSKFETEAASVITTIAEDKPEVIETTEHSEVWVSPEYLAELEFNGQTNQW